VQGRPIASLSAAEPLLANEVEHSLKRLAAGALLC
jgi:hypothetical protein